MGLPLLTLTKPTRYSDKRGSHKRTEPNCVWNAVGSLLFRYDVEMVKILSAVLLVDDIQSVVG